MENSDRSGRTSQETKEEKMISLPTKSGDKKMVDGDRGRINRYQESRKS